MAQPALTVTVTVSICTSILSKGSYVWRQQITKQLGTGLMETIEIEDAIPFRIRPEKKSCLEAGHVLQRVQTAEPSSLEQEVVQ